MVTKRHIRSISAKTRLGINRAFTKAKKDLKDYTLQKMKERKSGRTYRVYVGKGGRPLRRPRLHVASSKTEMPAILTGKLSKSLAFTQKYGHILTYGANTDYARRWEKSARSYILRTIKAKQKQIQNDIQEEIKRNLMRIA